MPLFHPIVVIMSLDRCSSSGQRHYNDDECFVSYVRWWPSMTTNPYTDPDPSNFPPHKIRSAIPATAGLGILLLLNRSSLRCYVNDYRFKSQNSVNLSFCVGRLLGSEPPILGLYIKADGRETCHNYSALYTSQTHWHWTPRSTRIHGVK